MPALIDITDNTYGRLRVIGRAGLGTHGKPTWECVCDPSLGGCGKTGVIVLGSMLRKKNGTRSCGCIQRESASAKLKAFRAANPNMESLIPRDKARVCKTCGRSLIGRHNTGYHPGRCYAVSRAKKRHEQRAGTVEIQAAQLAAELEERSGNHPES